MNVAAPHAPLHLVTAVHRGLAEHLGATAASVAALRAATPGRDVFWHVTVDGEGGACPDAPGADTLICAQHTMGVSAARNAALAAAAEGGWVFRLDGDDCLDVDGWVELFADPLFGTTAWCATNLLTFDGQQTVHWFDAPRRWARGQVAEQWTAPMLFHPNNIVVDAALALATGGWPALRVNEDIAYCFAVNDAEPGVALPHVTLRYRKWAHQTVAQDTYLRDKADAFATIAAVANARRARIGLGPVTAPQVGSAALYAPGR